ncbi:Thioredoxin-like proteins and domains [Nocardioides sp. J9]|uniref:NifU family protein n=1 Tax=Nocardioides sp. J9 TaxID=935844 RepID=UPI0011A40D84|nr:NifU family protein [Nocardioides sp. J9]TWG92785.1 Thioredoxin-like proteins and domains [Nocardioides sp. J9]TWH00507.1 Thioredoxin-like proteins and domains [Nocardioides sp. J9]
MTSLADRPVAPAPEDRDVEVLAQALDDAVAALAEVTDPSGQRVAQALRSSLEDVHRAALVHVVRRLRDDARGKELLFEIVDEPVVRMVLLMHGIIRPDPMTLARQALEQVRPQLQSHGGDVELVRIEGGTAFVRLSGACNGCSMSAVTMRNGVEEALKAQVPGIERVEVLPNEPGPTLIPLGEVGIRTATPERGWVRSLPIGEFTLDAITAVELVPDGAPAVDAIVVNVGGQLSAYVNECAHLAMPLDDAELDTSDGSLTCAHHGYCFDALSGECRTFPGAQLEQLPLRVEDGEVWIRVSA